MTRPKRTFLVTVDTDPNSTDEEVRKCISDVLVESGNGDDDDIFRLASVNGPDRYAVMFWGKKEKDTPAPVTISVDDIDLICPGCGHPTKAHSEDQGCLVGWSSSPYPGGCKCNEPYPNEGSQAVHAALKWEATNVHTQSD